MTKLVYDNIFDAIADTPQEAADLRFRADLVILLRDLFSDRGMKPADIARLLDVPQPRVSELLRGKIHLFSADKLIGYLAKMDVRLKPSLSDDKVVCDVLPAA